MPAFSLFFITFAAPFNSTMNNTCKYAARLLYIPFLIASLFFVVSCDDSDDETLVYLGLPQVYITTPSSVPITSKVDWVEGGNMRIVNSYGKEVLNETSDFRGRGNTTWYNMPKKPYAIKLDKRKKVLGMPDHKRWVMLANWMDRTLMRNAVAFEISRCCMEYTPRGQFVELFVNNEHKGNYYLCEQIKIDRNRLNISEISPPYSTS